MKISGFIKNSFIDYPGKLCSVIFTQGCNLNCGFCHNYDLIPKNNQDNNYLDEADIINYLSKANKLIDAVTITGGEACMQNDLIEFIHKIKNLNLSIKIDTNGCNSEMLEKLINEDLIDYIAMDIKTELKLDSYKDIVGKRFNQKDLDNILKSISILKKSNLETEFRTTLVKEKHSKQHVVNIIKYISDKNSTYTLQTFSNKQTLLKEYSSYSCFKDEDINDLISSYKDLFKMIRYI
ncbi:MAG: anaerobic ribonucleoside-triphosphate reductase activating protein [Marinifilaceae bacterium]|jgi:pyruvate formate lyase activating enzyme|nr:anaerobic ribonucleoside-triphosphate reductase activating protein [Marinifilaceae bacterium]